MLDADLAELYGVTTKRLNEQVKRNRNRFPEEFMFQLTKEELENWRSQIATSNPAVKMGLRRRPYAFTEYGAVMLANVLKSPTAVEVSILVVKAFIRMRQLLVSQKGLMQTSRSGIYHSSIQDSDPNHPQPGSHPPDTYFYYNNWSFNALGTIFEQLVGQSMGDAFKEWIADPIGMQDFQAQDVIYEHSHESVFPAYRFWMTGRDFARFGVLYLQQGNWKGNQIISADWVRESTTKYSDVGQFGYGYLWWTLDNGVYLASGTGGQKILVDPANKLVVVNRVDTGKGASRAWWIENGRSVNNTQFLEISRLIMETAPTM